MSLNIAESLDLLNFYLKKKDIKRSFIVCGGASLILQGLSRQGRVTKDIDVIAPEIDSALKEASISVANDLGLNVDWLNSDAHVLTKDLPLDWRMRILEIFKSSHLEVNSISRSDMIFAKFWAYCDRQQDLHDLIDLQITEIEIDNIADIIKTKDAHPNWPLYVEEQTQKLKQKMGYV